MLASFHSGKYVCFRNLLIKARKDSGLTQVELARHLSLPQSFVSKYERGERRLDFTEFIEISEILKIDLTKFILYYKKQLD